MGKGFFARKIALLVQDNFKYISPEPFFTVE